MLFELHDVLLHRLWKFARDRRLTLIREFLGLKYRSASQQRRYRNAYTFWTKAIVITREWYLNHKRADFRPIGFWA